MFKRQQTGSAVCPGCGRLVGVQDERCWNCGRARPSLFGFSRVLQRIGAEAAFPTVVIGLCALIFLLSLALAPSSVGTRLGFGFLAPDRDVVLLLGASGKPIVFDFGRVWTILSAGWLHGGLLHIGFNMYWVHQLGPTVSQVYGAARAAVIYLLSSAFGFLVTSALPVLAPWMPFTHRGVTLGASAAVFGWLGALLRYSRQSGSGLFLRHVLGVAIPLVFFGLILPGIDNWAHVGGLVGGYLIAGLYRADKPETPNEVLAALVLLALSVLSVPFSFLVPFSRVY